MPSPYRHQRADALLAQLLTDFPPAGARVAVIGTVLPWIEGALPWRGGGVPISPQKRNTHVADRNPTASDSQ